MRRGGRDRSTVEAMNSARFDPLAGDVALAAALFAFGLSSAASGDNPPSVYVLATIGILPLAARRIYPVGVLAIVTAATVYAAFAYDGGWWPFAAIVAFYSVAAHTSRRLAMLAGGIALGVLALGAAASISWHGLDGSARLAGDLAPLAAAWFLGDSLRTRRAYLRAVEERAEQLEREREANVRQAAAEEQARIAREVHDVVAHNLSVIVVQATAADAVFERDPEEARRAVRAIGTTGRQALHELRRVLGVIRTAEPAPDALSPQPGLHRLETLLAQVGAAGLEVELRIEGAPLEVPPAVGLSAYRIVQEALTNSMRHGHARHATVSLRYADNALVIEVVDDGTGTGEGANGAAHGLVGMRERAAIFGGQVDAGPRDRGGFRVSATLPVVPA
jgi:signal transduction histidine kinase